MKENQGSVWYDFSIDSAGNKVMNNILPSPEWLRNWMGEDYFQTVVHVRLDKSSVQDLAPLAKLTHLASVYVEDNSISDLAPLANLTALQRLYVSNMDLAISRRWRICVILGFCRS